MVKRIVIPVRMASTRLPEKPLLDLEGKSMVQRVYEKALACSVNSVLIATEDQRVVEAVQNFGGDVCLTSENHCSGTERLAEAVEKAGYDSDDVIINVQGDEPMIPVANIEAVGNNLLAHQQASMATLCEKIDQVDQVNDPNIVKVITDREGMAMYFSRAPIPWVRNYFPNQLPNEVDCYKHIGIYAYRAHFLKRYTTLAPSAIERWESLEQLRVLWHGHAIHVGLAACKAPPGIDTENDLLYVRRMLSQ